MVGGGWLGSGVVGCGQWWLVVAGGDCLWSVVVGCGRWWLVVVGCIYW